MLADGPPPRKLRVAPHGPLFRVPYHALPWNGGVLGETVEVALDPFPAGLPAIPNLRPAGRAWVLGYGGSSRSGIENEVRAVARILGDGGTEVEARAGALARVESVSAAAGEAALVHVAGHAVYRADHPEFSALRLADGWLTVSDLAAMPLDGACVVLSACETGPRGSVGGGEMLGLVRGLTRAGAAAVVASLWRVHDRAAVRFMRALYSRWRETGRLGEAMHAVQRAAARADVDPYLWAPFCLIGRGDVPWPGGPSAHSSSSSSSSSSSIVRSPISGARPV